MFNRKKKKPQISLPSNFEHRVHTGFDKREGRYVGLPLQWASIVGNNQILKSTNRPLPLVDPSEITHTEILDLKTIVRPHLNNNKLIHDDSKRSFENVSGSSNGLVLPKTSHVARSNSLRSSSPPRVRRDLRGNANVPPSVPEETLVSGSDSVQSTIDNTLVTAIDTLPQQPGSANLHQQQHQQFRRGPPSIVPSPSNFLSGPAYSMNPSNPSEWNRLAHAQSNGDQKGQNGNIAVPSGYANIMPTQTDMSAPHFR